MNITALFMAIVGAGIVIAGFFVASKIEKKSTSTIVKIACGAGGFLSMAVFPVDLNTSSQAGTYWFVLIVIAAVINKFALKK